ncbi:hypothetical protein H7J07_13715 [Mycobacterium koreense]|nr:hypothetical protein [Mycolicibacillus koreensis]MCV7249267.1 hypothetical protein [Mycolicibacillus koreensis]BBY53178.1 hypothetical protein MKOR_04290 [Mycolicibacillus koreensis]
MSDLVGVVGVVVVTVMYFLLQTDRVSPDIPLFSLLNAVGSLMIIFSLWFHWNLASAIMEAFWLSISVYGWIKALRSRPAPAPTG